VQPLVVHWGMLSFDQSCSLKSIGLLVGFVKYANYDSSKDLSTSFWLPLDRLQKEKDLSLM
jgi:hypothetical protein